ncbi:MULTISPECIES: hypothetical protein [unclassified Pseudomonas]|uniref:hypothetical protein n=1 Tax=unclassified Pseudomonas TaxID=196821 RepID=UPI00117A819A|nr:MULTISPECIES: hypothetical protein [unclassified Pseudomonas]
MTPAFQVFDEVGRIAIDTKMMAYSLRARNDFSIPGGGVNRLYVTVANAAQPIIFVRGAYTFLNQVTRSAGSMTFDFFVLLTSTGASGRYYVFDKSELLSGKSGLEMYDENGNVTFSSVHPPLNLVWAGAPPRGNERAPYNLGSTASEWSMTELPKGLYAGAVTGTRGGIDVQGDGSVTYADTMSEYVCFDSGENNSPHDGKGCTLMFAYDGNSIPTGSYWGRWYQRGAPPLIMIIDAAEYDRHQIS